jgi:alkylated DNA nucleotide flippase Atl1
MTAVATTSSPFTPCGERARWHDIYDHIATLAPGDVITYATIEDLCGGTLDRHAVYRAMKRLEVDNKRTLDNVRRTGYRVVEAHEHASLGLRHMKRSRRQVSKGLARVRSANRGELTDEQRAELDRLELRLAHVEQAQRKQAQRIERLESGAKASDSSLDEIRDALKRHGLL